MRVSLLATLFVIANIAFGQRGEQNGRGFSSLFGQVQRVGDQLFESVKEAGKVAQVLAGDAKDAIKTVCRLFMLICCTNLARCANFR